MTSAYRTASLEKVRKCYNSLTEAERTALNKGSLSLEQASSIESKLQREGLSLSGDFEGLKRCASETSDCLEEKAGEPTRSKLPSDYSLKDYGLKFAKMARLYAEEDEVKGVQAGLVAVAKGNVSGVQAGLVAVAKGNVSGVQASGIFALAHDVSGVQAGLGAVADDVYGVQASGIFALAHDVSGVQAGLIALANDVTGVQAAGLIAGADEKVYGVQAAGFCAVAYDVAGIQAAGLFTLAPKVKGVQAAGLIAGAKEVKGIQAAGILAGAEEVKGIQAAGLIAGADGKVYGVQAAGLVGLILGENNGLQISPLAISRKGTGRQIGILLWGPGNKWYNPSVFYQKNDDSREVEMFGTFKKIAEIIRRYFNQEERELRRISGEGLSVNYPEQRASNTRIQTQPLEEALLAEEDVCEDTTLNIFDPRNYIQP